MVKTERKPSNTLLADLIAVILSGDEQKPYQGDPETRGAWSGPSTAPPNGK